MDWYLDPADPDAPHRLREELQGFFARHASPDSDVDAAVLVAWELMTNVVRHAPGPMWVTLDWTRRRPRLEVHDLGPGFDLEEGLEKVPGPQGGFGLKLVSTTAHRLRADAKEAGGARVSATLPLYLREDADRSYDARQVSSGVTIVPSAHSHGWIDRESFLMAVATNLAQNIALEAGPELATRLINQVGQQVGAEMERAYRQANGLEGPLTVEQMTELFIGLKAAIEGDFYVIEADEDKIVLGNRCCPFGTEAARRAPALCQMTSAVFGGIAARNRRRGRVVLNERIAVGDPGCRVVIELAPNVNATGPDQAESVS